MVAWSDDFYVENYDALMAFAFRRLRDHATAEDAVQRTFMQALRAIDRLDDASNVRRWLYALLRNHLIDIARRREISERALRAAFPDASFELDGTFRAIEPETPSALVESDETTHEVRAVLATLKPRVRDVLVRYYLQGETIPEIMAKDGLTKPTVKSLLHRARRSFMRTTCPHPESSHIYDGRGHDASHWLGCRECRGSFDRAAT